MTNKFKVGDRIKRITESNEPDKYGVLGKIYTVDEVLSFGIKLKELPKSATPSAYNFVLVENPMVEVKVVKKLNPGEYDDLVIHSEEIGQVYITVDSAVNKKTLPKLIGQLQTLQDYLESKDV